MGEAANVASRNAIKIRKQRKRKRKIGWRCMRDVRCNAGRSGKCPHEPVANSGDRNARSSCDKRSRVADVYRRATKTQSRQSALVCQLEEPVPRFRARNCARRSSDRCDRRLRPMRKPRVESVSRTRNGKLALNAMTPAIPTPRLANPTSA